MRCLHFFVFYNCYLHVSRSPFSNMIYRKTKIKTSSLKCLKQIIVLQIQTKISFLTQRKITNDCRFGMQHKLYRRMTTNLQLIQAGVYRKVDTIRLNKINFFKVKQCSWHLKTVGINLSVTRFVAGQPTYQTIKTTGPNTISSEKKWTAFYESDPPINFYQPCVSLLLGISPPQLILDNWGRWRRC